MLNRIILFAIFLLTAFSVRAEDLQDENFLVNRPDGYELGSEIHNHQMFQQEFVPKGQTVTDWSEMMTVQTFYGVKDLGAADLLNRMQQKIGGICKNYQPQQITTNVSNGYPAAMSFFKCPLNPETGKPEVTVIRAIRGNDSLYVVQEAFRSDVSKDVIAMTGLSLLKALVCDTRSNAHPCPDLKQQGFVPLNPQNQQ